jgi:hypothetical protein
MIFANPQIAPAGRAEIRSAGQARAAVPTHAGWGQWTSDAEFLYFAVENGRVVRLILLEGRMVEINGKSVINHRSKIERFEWDGKTGKIFSSDNSAAESFVEKALESFTSE